MPRIRIIACLLYGLVSSAPAVDLVTIDGRRYQEAEVTWFYADAVIVRYEGVKYARLPLLRLRPESLVALGFPPPAEEPAEYTEGMDDTPIPAAPVQPTPRLRPLGAASGNSALRPATSRSRVQREDPVEPEVEKDDVPKRRMTPRKPQPQGIVKPKKNKTQTEQAPEPPENPFGALLEDMIEDNETKRLQDRKLDGEPEKLEIRPFPGDKL